MKDRARFASALSGEPAAGGHTENVEGLAFDGKYTVAVSLSGIYWLKTTPAEVPEAVEFNLGLLSPAVRAQERAT